MNKLTETEIRYMNFTKRHKEINSLFRNRPESIKQFILKKFKDELAEITDFATELQRRLSIPEFADKNVTVENLEYHESLLKLSQLPRKHISKPVKSTVPRWAYLDNQVRERNAKVNT